MKFAAVTTYAERHWEQHARRCVETFREHWTGVPLATYTDEQLEVESPWLADFKRRHRHRPTDDYRMDAIRFAHKIAAIDLADRQTQADTLIWIDADCVTHAPVTPEWLQGLLRTGDFAYLRRTMKYPECGFMMFRRNERGLAFIDKIVQQYRTDALFKLPEWHDSFVIDHVRAERESVGMLRCVSLSGSGERTHHPLINGPLGAKLDHLKGPRKSQGKSNPRDLKVLRSEDYWKGHNDQALRTNARADRQSEAAKRRRDRRASRVARSFGV
jgi:hypothetical protein